MLVCSTSRKRLRLWSTTPASPRRTARAPRSAAGRVSWMPLNGMRPTIETTLFAFIGTLLYYLVVTRAMLVTGAIPAKATTSPVLTVMLGLVAYSNGGLLHWLDYGLL